MRPEEVFARAELDRLLGAPQTPKVSERVRRAQAIVRGEAEPKSPVAPAEPRNFLTGLLARVAEEDFEDERETDAPDPEDNLRFIAVSGAAARLEAERLAAKYTPKEPPKVQRGRRVLGDYISGPTL